MLQAEISTQKQETRGYVKITSNYRTEKMPSEMPPFFPSVSLSSQGGNTVLEKINQFQYLILASWTLFPCSPRCVLRKIWTAFDYIERNQPEATFSVENIFLYDQKFAELYKMKSRTF